MLCSSISVNRVDLLLAPALTSVLLPSSLAAVVGAGGARSVLFSLGLLLSSFPAVSGSFVAVSGSLLVTSSALFLDYGVSLVLPSVSSTDLRGLLMDPLLFSSPLSLLPVVSSAGF
jgi:hypothetical protein